MLLVVWVLLVASCVHGLVDSQRDMVGLVQHETLQHPKVKLEQHFVETADGYILGVFRLRNPELVKAPVVLLMHGLMDSSIVWVNNGRERSLGLVLAELGYDVWLGNNRGNAWSRRHVSLNPNTDSRFWDFSFDEMGEFDLPAVVDFCLQVSQQAKLTYVGHSQGSTQLIAALSTESGRQALGGKISHFVGLAPAVFEFHMKSVLMKAMAEMDADRLTTLIGINEFAPSSKLLSTLLPEFCRANPKLVCEHMLDMVYGKSKHLNVDREDVFLSQFPSGTSSRNVQHWAQHTRQPVFQRFDFGRRGNLAKYGTARRAHRTTTWAPSPRGSRLRCTLGRTTLCKPSRTASCFARPCPRTGTWTTCWLRSTRTWTLCGAGTATRPSFRTLWPRSAAISHHPLPWCCQSRRRRRCEVA